MWTTLPLCLALSAEHANWNQVRVETKISGDCSHPIKWNSITITLFVINFLWNLIVKNEKSHWWSDVVVLVSHLPAAMTWRMVPARVQTARAHLQARSSSKMPRLLPLWSAIYPGTNYSLWKLMTPATLSNLFSKFFSRFVSRLQPIEFSTKGGQRLRPQYFLSKSWQVHRSCANGPEEAMLQS